jgi:hypothetical protein
MWGSQDPCKYCRAIVVDEDNYEDEYDADADADADDDDYDKDNDVSKTSNLLDTGIETKFL